MCMDGQTDESTHTQVQTRVMDAETEPPEPPGRGMLHEPDTQMQE